MIIETKKNDGKTTVGLVGRLDSLTAPELTEKVDEILEGTEELIFDLKELEYVSSAGLRALLSAQKKALEQGSMKLINLSEDIMEIMDVTGFSSIMTIE